MTKKILLTMMVVMVVLTGLVWYAKKNNIKIPGVTKAVPSTNWQWSNDWNNPTGPTFDDGSRPDVPKPIGPNGVRVQPQVQPPAEIVLMGYQEAMKRSAAEGKPVLVMFTASWCSWCNKFKKEVLIDPAVRTACSNYLFTMVDSDQEKVAVRKFGVTSLPSFVITNSKEQKLKSQDGFMDAAKFVQFLDNPSMFNQPKAEPQQPGQPPQQPQPKQQPDRRFLPRRQNG